MSRKGKAPIKVPAGVTVKVDGQTVSVKGPKGELTRTFRPEISINQEDGQVTVVRDSD
ncbi:MAG: 50S ribosomal protein L6, partial [Cyanobacteria bacterium]|nr:50S ribosomal protein L6 [Cyanobacteriota bacterium]